MEDDGNIQTIDKSGNCRQLGSETGILAPTGNGHVPSPLNQEPDIMRRMCRNNVRGP